MEIMELKLKHKDEIIELTNRKIITNNNITNNNKFGIVYIISSLFYQLQNIYKIGYSENTIKERLAGYYTTGHIESVKLKYIYKLETIHYKELEKLIFEYLKDYKINNEMYKIDLEKLKKLIKKINSKFKLKINL